MQVGLAACPIFLTADAPHGSPTRLIRRRHGADLSNRSDEPAECGDAAEGGRGPLVAPDATVDPRFNTSVRVTGRECVQYYVGLMLVTSDGIELGTVSVSDGLPRCSMC
ncbi:hypothetical protein H257_17578 [Aphanomyces astaci]|uniref:Uncharacterized protein n=1 Tax=Aphanomyces astaci TaxID=112090 RepID=W4FEC4_APHAT|nr:hypothetical protein H257_17578 [Aphanomyces astaci]ETV65857.1 hypothetical protein H257_17578 [Aphanomyces astaci]|eukprot:XP_009844720.1 hypothetical protein H257_17578 [Aphanomyces astaci]